MAGLTRYRRFRYLKAESPDNVVFVRPLRCTHSTHSSCGADEAIAVIQQMYTEVVSGDDDDSVEAALGLYQ